MPLSGIHHTVIDDDGFPPTTLPDRQAGAGMTILFLLLTTLSSIRADSSSEAYFPWTQGDSWVYDTIKKGEKEPFEMKVVIEGPWGGREFAKNLKDQGVVVENASLPGGMIMTQKDKRGTMREFLLRTKKGIFIQRLGLSKSFTPEVFTHFNPPVPRLIFPLEPGTKVHWEGRLKIAWVDKPILFDGEVMGWEDIEVPAGKFHCIKLHYHEKRGEEIIDENVWYAEGIGQVKYDGGQYIKELKSYKAKSD